MLRSQRPSNMENVYDPYTVTTLSKAHYTHPVPRFDPTLQQNCASSKVLVSSSFHVPGGLGLWSDGNGFEADSQITVMGVDKKYVISNDQVKRFIR